MFYRERKKADTVFPSRCRTVRVRVHSNADCTARSESLVVLLLVFSLFGVVHRRDDMRPDGLKSGDDKIE